MLFACVHNAGRSQMAAALVNRFADSHRARAISAGIDPADHVDPDVVRAMLEIGVDISNQEPRRLTDELANDADWLITMGCGERCPLAPGTKRDDWAASDPRGLSFDQVRNIRDDIRARVQELIDREQWR